MTNCTPGTLERPLRVNRFFTSPSDSPGTWPLSTLFSVPLFSASVPSALAVMPSAR